MMPIKRFCLFAAASAPVLALLAQGGKPAPKLDNAIEFAERFRAAYPAAPAHLFSEGEFATVNLLTPSAEVPPHYHAKHDEVVYIARGKGRMRLGDNWRDVGEGDLMYIPRGTVHAFKPGPGDCIALSVFAPKFDGTDRIPAGGG